MKGMLLLRKHWQLILVCSLLIFSGIIWLAVFASRERAVVSVTFFDVGEGDATLILGKAGEQVLIDGGPNRNTLALLSKTLPLFDRSLDMVIETYPDKDNGGGLPYVLNQYAVGTFVTPNEAKSSTIDTEIARIKQEKNIPSFPARKGMIFRFGDGSYIEILSANTDESSILRYVYENTCFLLMGDADVKTEKSLVAEYADLPCQVLKVGHHGSKSGTSDDLLTAVSPEYAVISTGKDNRYSYPDQEVVDALDKLNIKILNTRDLGTISMSSDGNIVSVK